MCILIPNVGEVSVLFFVLLCLFVARKQVTSNRSFTRHLRRRDPGQNCCIFPDPARSLSPLRCILNLVSFWADVWFAIFTRQQCIRSIVVCEEFLFSIELQERAE